MKPPKSASKCVKNDAHGNRLKIEKNDVLLYTVCVNLFKKIEDDLVLRKTYKKGKEI